MVPIVEEILRELITQQLKVFKDNPNIIDKIFVNAKPKLVDNLKSYFKTNKFTVVNGFPREPNVLPCFCILLGQENEQAEGLGDVLDNGFRYGDETFDEYEERESSDMLPIKSEFGVHFVDLVNPDVVYVENVRINGTPVPYSWEEGNGRVTINYDIGNQQLSALVDYSYRPVSTTTYGTEMQFNYRIECWTDNADLSSTMYHLLKFIMLANRSYLLESGIRRPVMGGGDLEPVPDYFPTFVYRRALTLNGEIDNSVNVDELVTLGYTLTQHVYSSPVTSG